MIILYNTKRIHYLFFVNRTSAESKKIIKKLLLVVS